MKIVVVGLRGFPNIQGGIETHCEELYPRIAQLGHEIIVVRRKNFVKENLPYQQYKGVTFKDISSPSISGFEAAIHTALGILYAKKIHADIIHVHAIGPSIMIPLAKLFGIKIVMTHHGPDYNRERWGLFAKIILKTGEYFAARQADDIIAISTVITDILEKKYKRTKNVHLIYNGVTIHPRTDSTSYISSLNLQSGKYILAVGRFVQEKRFDKLIDAYLALNNTKYKLVIAGDADNETDYSKTLKEYAIKNNIILTGMIKGSKLQELYSNARLFVLPSSHEGLPITLLEAMSYNIDVLISNIPSNIAVNLPANKYFSIYDPEDLKEKINNILSAPQTETHYNLEEYNWDYIAKQTFSIY